MGPWSFQCRRLAGDRCGDGAAEPRVGKASVGQTATRMLLEHHTPAAVVVDREGGIVYFHGRTEKFVEQPRGEPTRDLLVLAKENVRGAVRTALQRAVSQGEAVTVRDGVVEADGLRMRVEVAVAPMVVAGTATHFLVSFLERPEPMPSAPQRTSRRRSCGRIWQVRDELQSTIEELQTSNEEMKVSGEEATSINEELHRAEHAKCRQNQIS